MKLLLFEDANVELLYPLTYLRAVFELRCGTMSLRERIERKFPDAQHYLETRKALRDVTAEAHGTVAVNHPAALHADDDLLLVNAGAILTGESAAYRREEKVGLTPDGQFIWAFLKRETVGELGAETAGILAEKAAGRLPVHTVDDILIRYPWNLIDVNPEQIARDFAEFYSPAVNSPLQEGVYVAGAKENLCVGEGVEIQPCVFIDCRQGPVVIGDNVTVRAHTSIEGPCFLGNDTMLFEAKIREGCSIGECCRVGGEVEESIIHGHSNKYHTGFLGHSYVCEWVNLGALTTNSDLKNDYSSVQVYVNGTLTDTGSIKVGAFIGDHTKTSIGTMLNTGTNAGIMCNLMAGSSVLPKYIPSFCWFVQDRFSKGLGLRMALETARTAMNRRKVELTDAMVELIRHTEQITKEERMEKIRRDRRKAR